MKLKDTIAAVASIDLGDEIIGVYVNSNTDKSIQMSSAPFMREFAEWTDAPHDMTYDKMLVWVGAVKVFALRKRND